LNTQIFESDILCHFMFALCSAYQHQQVRKHLAVQKQKHLIMPNGTAKCKSVMNLPPLPYKTSVYDSFVFFVVFFSYFSILLLH